MIVYLVHESRGLGRYDLIAVYRSKFAAAMKTAELNLLGRGYYTWGQMKLQ